MVGLKVTRRVDLTEAFGRDSAEVFAEAEAAHKSWRQTNEAKWQATWGTSSIVDMYQVPRSRAGKDDEALDTAAENFRATGKRQRVLVPNS